MIPIDNSIAGRVADIHHFLPTSGLHIIGEHFLRIQFALMGVAGSSLDTIRTVHSHVHALGQCRKVIRELGLTPVIAGDTAGAAREVSELADVTQAAIAPPLAAEIYGLTVLRDDVEDEDHNTTRFVVLSREPDQAPAGNGPVVTSFVFNVRNLPAALYKALGGFATNGVNMTKLESYMVGGEFTATQFLAEVDGHPDDPGLEAGARGAVVLHHRRHRDRGLPGGPVPWLTTAGPAHRRPRLRPGRPRPGPSYRRPGGGLRRRQDPRSRWSASCPGCTSGTPTARCSPPGSPTRRRRPYAATCPPRSSTSVARAAVLGPLPGGRGAGDRGRGRHVGRARDRRGRAHRAGARRQRHRDRRRRRRRAAPAARRPRRAASRPTA